MPRPRHLSTPTLSNTMETTLLRHTINHKSNDSLRQSNPRHTPLKSLKQKLLNYLLQLLHQLLPTLFDNSPHHSSPTLLLLLSLSLSSFPLLSDRSISTSTTPHTVDVYSTTSLKKLKIFAERKGEETGR
ncbi:hypothetical protein PGT21_020373 [Puccinia graminis f. sp. tritici]|uniref:Uncharacterized protein n=1 Tax=Puccinia graminis f. sp. tritici TaxID=56615 RepID=A0A5B0N4N3_PUCGR|nr:hypothetical protein PGT21_020373 [Puccinia graminis f. sp. tritici]